LDDEGLGSFVDEKCEGGLAILGNSIDDDDDDNDDDLYLFYRLSSSMSF
jgi:hypothetical protein